jgi:hypothetical protein
VINPATGLEFRVALQKGIDVNGPPQLEINSLGQPTATTTQTYVLTAQGNILNVNVAALTGVVTVLSP